MRVQGSRPLTQLLVRMHISQGGADLSHSISHGVGGAPSQAPLSLAQPPPQALSEATTTQLMLEPATQDLLWATSRASSHQIDQKVFIEKL